MLHSQIKNAIQMIDYLQLSPEELIKSRMIVAMYFDYIVFDSPLQHFSLLELNESTIALNICTRLTEFSKKHYMYLVNRYGNDKVENAIFDFAFQCFVEFGCDLLLDRVNKVFNLGFKIKV